MKCLSRNFIPRDDIKKQFKKRISDVLFQTFFWQGERDSTRFEASWIFSQAVVVKSSCIDVEKQNGTLEEKTYLQWVDSCSENVVAYHFLVCFSKKLLSILKN